MQFDNPKKKNERPLLSVITVVRNGDKILEKTILNVLNQSYDQIEYIIIDGGSTDETLDIIKKYENNIACWISEPDKGIYDAMNKGITRATGMWINFMNAGDEFYDLNTCKIIAKSISENSFDVIYGDFVAKNDLINLEILVKAKPLNSIWKGNLFSHQSCFIRYDVLRNNLFDINYKIVADFNQMVSILLQRKVFFYLPIPFSIMQTGGVSYSNIRTYIEQIKVVHAHKPYSIYLFSYIPLMILALVRTMASEKLTLFIRRAKWKYMTSKTTRKFL
jgi:glycosyltransferase involved in cell wall biosynthesis